MGDTTTLFVCLSAFSLDPWQRSGEPTKRFGLPMVLQETASRYAYPHVKKGEINVCRQSKRGRFGRHIPFAVVANRAGTAPISKIATDALDRDSEPE